MPEEKIVKKKLLVNDTKNNSEILNTSSTSKQESWVKGRDKLQIDWGASKSDRKEQWRANRRVKKEEWKNKRAKRKKGYENKY